MFYNRHAHREGGFTLLEIMMVLFILLILAAIAVPATAGLAAQERLKSQARALQDFAVSARKLAVTGGRSYEIVLKEGGFVLEAATSGKGEKPEVIDSVKLPSQVAYSVRHWGAAKPGKPAGESWVFRPDGICEPIRVHFQNDDGWLEFSFNPLTASPCDDESHFR